MAKLRSSDSYGLGGKTASEVFENHFSSDVNYPKELKTKIASMGLNRVAGNIYECPSDKSFWAVKGGKVIKLVGDEVDNGEKLKAAPANDPAGFLDDILGDLTF